MTVYKSSLMYLKWNKKQSEVGKKSKKKKKGFYEIFKEIIIQHDGRKINQTRVSSKQVSWRELTFVVALSVRIGRLNSK